MNSRPRIRALTFVGTGTTSNGDGAVTRWPCIPTDGGTAAPALWLVGTRGAGAVMTGTAVPGCSSVGSRGSIAGSVGRPRPYTGGSASAPGEGGG